MYRRVCRHLTQFTVYRNTVYTRRTEFCSSDPLCSGSWAFFCTADLIVQIFAGDCATASGFVSYLGPFNKEFRELLLTRDFQAGAQKLNIPASNNLNVTTFLAEQPEIGQWNLQVCCSISTKFVTPLVKVRVLCLDVLPKDSSKRHVTYFNQHFLSAHQWKQN